jgi:hypothetical protein
MKHRPIGNLLSHLTVTGALFLIPCLTQGGEPGHFNPGIPSIRDFAMPDSGLYFVLYNYGYETTRFNDADGNKIQSININPGPGPGVTVNLSVEIDMYAIAPMAMWVSDWKVLGAKYATYILPSFANTSIGASLDTARGFGRSVSAGTFDVADLFVQPVWLGWSSQHSDLALGYGFYAPTGRYDTRTVTLPRLGRSITLASPDNIGLGFWTNQFQGSAYWYPWVDKRMAIGGALTYEINSEKEDFNITPGQDLSLNWGISQYLPLTKDMKLLAEVGPAGYDTWQITDSSGQGSRDSVREQVHAVGGQLGLSYVPWNLALNFHYLYEYYSEDRFQGEVIGLNVYIKW